MSEDVNTLFDVAIAGPLDDVVAAMNESHDTIIRRAGNRRTSGVWWEVYGPDMAGLLASNRGKGPSEPNGDWKAGIVRLEELLDQTTIEKIDYLASIIAFASDFTTPTMVVAFCYARPSAEVRREQRRRDEFRERALEAVDGIVEDPRGELTL